MMPFSCWSSESVVTLRNLGFDLVVDSTVKALDQDPCMLPWFFGLSCPRRCSEICMYPGLNKKGLDYGFCGEKKRNRKTWEPDSTTRVYQCFAYPANLNLAIWPSGMSASVRSSASVWGSHGLPSGHPRDQLAPLLCFKSQKKSKQITGRRNHCHLDGRKTFEKRSPNNTLSSWMQPFPTPQLLPRSSVWLSDSLRAALFQQRKVQNSVKVEECGHLDHINPSRKS